MMDLDSLFKFRIGERVWHKERVVDCRQAFERINGVPTPKLDLLNPMFVIERWLVDDGQQASQIYTFRVPYHGASEPAMFRMKVTELLNESETMAMVKLIQANK